jgi:PAS domain S-box-containing protein
VSQKLLRRAHEVAGIGTYTIDLERQIIHLSAEMAHLYRVGEEPFDLPLADYRRRFYHADDLVPSAAKADSAYESAAGAMLEARVVRGDGEIIWVRSSSSVEVDERGVSVVVGVVMDVTDTRDASIKEREQAALIERVSERLRLATATADIGIWDWDIEADHMEWDDTMFRLYGTSREATKPSHRGWAATLTPETRERAVAELHRAMARGGGYDNEYDVRWPDGTVHVLRSSAHVVQKDGRPTRVVGVNYDVTTQRRAQHALAASEQRFRHLSENALVGVYVLEGGRLSYVNGAVERTFGYEPGELLGVDPMALFHPDDRVFAADAMRRRRAGELVGVPLDVRGVRKDGAILSLVVLGVVSTLDGRSTVIGNILDVTSRREDADRIRRLNRMLRTLSSVNELLIRASEESHLFQDVCRISVEKAGFLAAWIGLADRTTGRVNVAAAAGAHDFLHGLELRWDRGPLAAGPTGTAIREGRTVVLDDFADDGRPLPWRDIGRERGLGSCAVTPIRRGGAITGSLALYAAEPGAFDAEIVRLIEEMAADIGFALSTIDDRSRIRRAEDEARRVLLAIEQVTDSVLITDAAGAIVYANPAACHTYGYELGEIIGQRPQLWKEGSDAVAVDDEMWRTIRGGAPWHGTIVNRTRTGETVHLSATVGPIRGASGAIDGFVGVSRDVSRERALLVAKEVAEQANRASEERFRALIENAPLGIGVSRNGETLYVNRACAKMLGFERGDDLVGRSLAEFWAPEMAPEFERRDRARLAGLPVSPHYEADAVRRDGTRFHAEVDAFEMDLPDGRAVVGFIRDITERVRAEAALRDNELRFRTFIEKAPLAVGLSRGGTTVYANEKFLELWRYKSNDDVVGRPVLEHWAPEVRPHIADRVRRRTLGLPIAPEDLLAQRSDGTVFPAHIATVGVELPDGPVTAAFITDETERHRADEAMRAKDAAEQASRAKSSFLAHVSHEIRTPMNAILGYAQLLLRDDSLSAPQRRQVEVIQSSGTHLLQVLNDVLEMSKIEAGRVSLTVAPFDLRAMLGEVESMFRVLTSAKGIALAVESDATLPRGLEADGAKIKQVLINLLSNAVKFTDSGKVAVRVTCAPTAADGRRVRVDVEDTGIGIDAEGLDRLFRTFEQLAAGARIGGTGLGLAISRNFAQLMGGDVTVQSTPGAGSLFTFTFEAKLGDVQHAEADPRGAPVRVAADQRRPKILVVDDIATNRDLCRELLAQVGFVTREASNGEEALVVHESWHPDLVLMDLRMPGMDGFDATRRLRAAGSTARIVALTASGLSDVEPDALAAGADMFLRKPYDDRDLLRRIGDLLRVEYEYEAPVPPSLSAPPERVALSQLLAELPTDLRGELREAATAARARRITELATRVGEHSEAAAAAIDDLTRRFRYDLILAALKGVSDG